MSWILATPEQSALSPFSIPTPPPVTFPCYFSSLQTPSCLRTFPLAFPLPERSLSQICTWLVPSSLHSKVPLGKVIPDHPGSNFKALP